MKEVFQINRKERKESTFVPFFLVSLAVAMLFMVLNQSELLLQSDVLSESALSLVKKEGNGSSLFICVLKERIWVIPMLFLLSTTYLAGVFVHGVIAWYGMSFGALTAMAMLRYKLRGVLFLIMCGFPQYLFYVPAFAMALRLSVEQRIPDKKFFLQLTVLEGVVLIGCLAESYVNSLFVEKIIKIFIGV